MRTCEARPVPVGAGDNKAIAHNGNAGQRAAKLIYPRAFQLLARMGASCLAQVPSRVRRLRGANEVGGRAQLVAAAEVTEAEVYFAVGILDGKIARGITTFE
eukprot:6183520-Pyramimonas_sp.AAC.1